ncbi:MAG TPA: CDC27 family protein [Candidatus Sumerlaeota bacterium]|nr:MAG: Serine/threonine-protein kinase PK-1 [candidate division BRC1 bacterium ADurb.Bin183]HOE64446.1 CDC27 family protein [Candidatus Sumerlaeota bacterium]HRR30601.1 CDC27 family protein [Candidatus Sumerlaeia bacterium]HON49995.1 CDC27 family protein [Candidatus Sumerlaeota bacterium]HOR65872.1 CDC27 family protein [Candidatus Sumerlaeota bacterium]
MNITLDDIERSGIFREEALGRVFEAKLKGAQRKLIVKEFLSPLSLDKKSRVRLQMRFLEDSRILKTIVNPSIAIPLAVIDNEENTCAIFSHPNGIPFYNFIASKGNLEHLASLNILKRMVQCFQILAKSGIHRANVIPNDFFIAENESLQMADTAFASFDKSSGLHDAGLLTGDRSFYSPEQIIGGKTGEQCLIFSLGLLFYYMLIGDRLHKSASPYETLSQIINKPFASLPKKIHPSGDLEELVRRMLYKDESRRFASLSELNKFIDTVIEREKVEESLRPKDTESRISREITTTMTIKKPVRRWGILATILVVFAAAILLGKSRLFPPAPKGGFSNPASYGLLESARQAIDAKEWEKARLFAKNVLDNEGSHPTASLFYGEALFNLGDYKEAVIYLREAKKSSNEAIVFRAGLLHSDCYVHLANYREAERYLSNMLKSIKDSERKDIIQTRRKHLIALCLTAGQKMLMEIQDSANIANSLKDMMKVIERINPNAVEIGFFKGALAYTYRDLNSAMQYLNDYCALRPNDAVAAVLRDKIKMSKP